MNDNAEQLDMELPIVRTNWTLGDCLDMAEELGVDEATCLGGTSIQISPRSGNTASITVRDR